VGERRKSYNAVHRCFRLVVVTIVDGGYTLLVTLSDDDVVTVNFSLSTKRTGRKRSVIFLQYNPKVTVNDGPTDSSGTEVPPKYRRIGSFRHGHVFDRWRRWPSRRESSSGAVVMPPTPPRHSAAGVCRVEAANDNYIIAYVEKGEKNAVGDEYRLTRLKIIIISISISIVLGRVRCIDSGRRVPFAVCTPARNHTHTRTQHTYINIRLHALTHAHTHTHDRRGARCDHDAEGNLNGEPPPLPPPPPWP